MRTGFMHHRKRMLALAIILALVVSVVITIPVRAAASNGTKCDPISSGLWAGVNFILNTNYGCKHRPQDKQTKERRAAPRQEPSQPRQKYVALGDSVAAGIGLSPRTTGPDRACGVTDRAYPARVSAALNISVQNLACSGATAGDLVSEQHLSGTSRDIEPQLTRAFAGGKPSLITVTAGANDTYWDYFLRKCYTGGCGTDTDKAISAGLLTALELKLEYILTDINSRSNGKPPRVIFTGYYQPLSLACAQRQTNATRAEIKWLRGQTQALNQTIRNVVDDYSFARYAPIDFSGHGLCSSDPWVQSVNAAAPFHPTARGQQAIANAVLAHVR